MSRLPSTLASFMYKTAIFFLSFRVIYTNNAYYHFQLSTSCHKLCILMKTWCSTVICKYNVTVNDVHNENYIAFLCNFLMIRLPGKWRGWPRFGTGSWYRISGIIFTLFWLKRAQRYLNLLLIVKLMTWNFYGNWGKTFRSFQASSFIDKPDMKPSLSPNLTIATCLAEFEDKSKLLLRFWAWRRPQIWSKRHSFTKNYFKVIFFFLHYKKFTHINLHLFSFLQKRFHRP